jgi:2-amino-4-hydroxy-6-hydroxymethyldihydropteridine diphosphokinase
VIRIAIGLGGNLGDRQGHLERAVHALGALGHGLRLASLYETPPVGPPQPDYLNSALSLLTALSPEEVLARALEIERSEGRVRAQRWGPRTLDLDLLDYHGLVRRPPARPVLPHPGIAERIFVLAPLAEIAPHWRHPLTRRTACQMLRRLDPSGEGGLL